MRPPGDSIPSDECKAVSNACVACGSAGTVIAYGRVAPFIVELAGLHDDESIWTSLARCEVCDFVWHTTRFADSTLEAIYGEYRDGGYVSTRRKWEPWYSSSVNNAYDPGSPKVADRTAFMGKVLATCIDVAALRCIADYGGDMGQFFPPGFTGAKFVVEVSGKPLVSGVKSVASLGDLPEPAQLVICAHVLEHLPDPSIVLREIRAALPDGGYIYVEVPLDRPSVRPWHATPKYRSYLATVARMRPAFVLADFITGVSRNFGHAIPRLGIVKESEHINYFGPRSMRALLESEGLTVVEIVEDPGAVTGGMRMGRMGVLAMREAQRDAPGTGGWRETSDARG